MNKFNLNLDRCGANFQPLTPINLLLRSAEVFPDRTAVIYNDETYTWSEYSARCHQLARALISAGVQPGDTVSIMAPNTPPMLESTFGVPMSGAVLNCINIRLDAATVSYVLEHSETKVFLVDRQFAAVAREAVAALGKKDLLIIDIADAQAPYDDAIGSIQYEAFLEQAPQDIPVVLPDDEWDAITLNYTSGTTGAPKGVVYHHRGAYLSALSQIVNANLLGRIPVYLWTLPLFHCNGWCYAWAMAAVGGTNVCMRQVSAKEIFQAIERHNITHFCCAPTVLSFLINDQPEHWQKPDHPIKVVCAGAAPPIAILEKTIHMGFDVVHVYGMTEQHGIATICEPQEAWAELDHEEQMRMVGRQGVRVVVVDDLIVCSPETYEPVPRDGETIGEVMIRGNLAMKGYLKDAAATQETFANDWYHTGDLAVVHKDGYLEIKDRSKDLIISGGENISSLEIENVLYTHPGVSGAAVVAVSDDKWGEVPCALIELQPGYQGKVTEQQIVDHCRERMAGFKIPKHVIFEPLARTATGKLQKFKLRDHAQKLVAERSNATNTF